MSEVVCMIESARQLVLSDTETSKAQMVQLEREVAKVAVSTVCRHARVGKGM